MDLPQSGCDLFPLGHVYLCVSKFSFLMVSVFINKSAFSGIYLFSYSACPAVLTEVEGLTFQARRLRFSATSVTYPVGLGMSFDP